MNINIGIKTQSELDRLLQVYSIQEIIAFSSGAFSTLFNQYQTDVINYYISNNKQHLLMLMLSQSDIVVTLENLEYISTLVDLSNTVNSINLITYLYQHDIKPSSNLLELLEPYKNELYENDKVRVAFDILAHTFSLYRIPLHNRYSDKADCICDDFPQFRPSFKTLILNTISVFAAKSTYNNTDIEHYVFGSKEVFNLFKEHLSKLMDTEKQELNNKLKECKVIKTKKIQSTSISLDKWNYINITYNNEETVNLYVDVSMFDMSVEQMNSTINYKILKR